MMPTCHLLGHKPVCRNSLIRKLSPLFKCNVMVFYRIPTRQFALVELWKGSSVHVTSHGDFVCTALAVAPFGSEA